MVHRMAFLLFLSMCLINISGCAQEQAQTGENTRAVTVINVEADNWSFNKEVYKVFAGKKITINFKSVEGNHGLGIRGIDSVNIEGEGSVKLTLEPGEYQIYCTIPCGEGHKDMIATLIAV
ncbi:hypothetical protein ACSVDE_03645 [Pseudalkalibacillus sp. Hm43]|uniref:hypothetical protein n=1 Tax=Pseudalkalibacillus sp. Hm43 TaxID=3450742 RepID=UPI003F42F083